MANTGNGIELNLRVNTETGQLEVLGAKFRKVGEDAKQAQGSFAKLGGEAGSLLKSFLPFATAGGIVAFFTSAIKGAEEQNESMRRLRGTVEATGQAWGNSQQAIQEWTTAIATATRFSGGDALAALDKLTRATGNLSQGQAAASLAMDLSVKTGKELSETTQLVNDLVNKNERAVKLASREYGVLTGNARDAQGMLDALRASAGGAAEAEQSLTKDSHQLANAFGDFKDTIGNAFAPAISAVMGVLTGAVRQIDKMGTAVATAAAIVGYSIAGLNEALERAFKFDFSGAKEALKGIGEDVKNLSLGGEAMLAESETRKTDIIKQHAAERIQVNHNLNDQELQALAEANQKAADAETERFQSWAAQREKQIQLADQFERQMDQNITSIGVQTLSKKQQLLDQEISARRAKINREVSDETMKRNLLIKLDQEKAARSTDLMRLENQVRMATALETVDIGLQTLGILNSLGESHGKGEVQRAKAILALEKSIAIARAIAAAMAAPPGVAQALAAAQVAFVVAQFAQQSRAIDQAASAQRSGAAVSSVTTDLPNGDTLTRSVGDFTGGGGGGSLGGGGGSLGGGGGGGGGNVINVGGIVVNFDVDRLSVDNVDAIMDRMYEKVRQGTVEGVQLAVAMRNVGEKNSGLAV